MITEENKSNDIIENKKRNKVKELELVLSSEKAKQKLSEQLKSKFNMDLIDLKYLKRGGGSYIYEAVLKEKRNSVIIKVIYDEKNKNFHEPKIMAKLRNKHIIQIIGYYSAKNEDQIIIMEKGKMDLIELQYNLLKRYVLSETLMCYITEQILQGLKYLHKCNIIHHDIKPNNIIIDEYLIVKIIDFSASLDISEIKGSEVRLKYRGTSFYIAPEVIRRDKINIKDYHKIDLFSLGVLIYTMAFGFYPFNLQKEDIDDDNKILEKINSDWKVENIDKQFSENFIDFLNKLLEKNINKRINIKEALNHPWIQGAKIILNEKENINNANVFLASLITDNFMSFNNYNSIKN